MDVFSETIRSSISLRLADDFLHVMCIKNKLELVFNFIFDLLWADRWAGGGDSSVFSAAFYGSAS